MIFSFQREVIGYGFVAALATCVAAGVSNVNVEVVHVNPSDLQDPTDEPVVEKMLKEFEEANKRTPDYLLEACPPACTDFDSKREWFVYSDAARLALCEETMLLEFAVAHDLESKNDKTAIRACKANYGAAKKVDQSLETASICTTPNHLQINVPIKISAKGSAGRVTTGVLAAAKQIDSYVSSQPIFCNNNIFSFGYSGGSVVGLYSGKEVHQQGVTAQLLGKFQEYVQKGGVPESVVVQLCNVGGRGADYAIGIAASLSGDLSFVQNAAKAWNDGKCVSGIEEVATLAQLRFNVPDINAAFNSTSNSTEPAKRLTEVNVFRPRLAARANCRTTKVESGDGCFAVAARCGISQTDLTKYNTRANFCTTLVAGETVCCSTGTLPETTPPPNSDGTCQTRRIEYKDECPTLAAKCGITPAEFTKFNPDKLLCSSLAPGGIVCCGRGTLPDIKQKPNPDGSCHVYNTNMHDSCSMIAASNGINVAKLEEFNKNTWGWNGCKVSLWVGVNVCVSAGNPPMPAPVSNAVCGPTVPGTQKPPSGTNITSLNPCLLKVCCNIWGQCGTTADFCVISKSETGAPGTSAPKTNGCIANCGMGIISSGPPAKKIKVAYFESWNWGRACLNMHVDSIDTSVYTHIHFAFANITADFQVDVSGAQGEFDRFKKMTGVKKIMSFGGWAFSTEPGTSSILREATKAGNRAKFTTNLSIFAAANGLDGIDLDWEYPGVPSSPGVPGGDPAEGMDYYNTLAQLKTKIGSGKTVSFAAPASYWYLKAFPIELMGAAIDYIIYMTYDLHGQWDYGNKWTSPGCPTGNCLRSHVNLTETINALSMITKAGVASNKIVVGVTSYGRSFKMAQAGCTGPECLFTGSATVSDAAKGDCTDTGGYISNAEIKDIISQGGVQQYTVEHSNVVVYGGGTEWVAYMNDTIKAGREMLYDAYNFAGTTDWAVDLQDYTADEGEGEEQEEDPTYGTDWEYQIRIHDKSSCTSKYRSLDQLEKDADKIPADCFDKYLVDVEVAILKDSLNSYDSLINGGYDDKFSVYERAMHQQIPQQVYKYMGDAQKTGFFECTETKHMQCCNDCSSAYSCPNGCTPGSGCKSGKVTVKADCPTMLAHSGFAYLEAVPNITYKCTDTEGFYKDIADKYGIDRSWITWGRRHVLIHSGCQYEGDKFNDCVERNDGFWYNYPNPAGKIEIPNPKSIIGRNYTQMRGLTIRMENESKDADISLSMVSRSDIVDSGSLPALMIQFAITNMNKIVETANEIIEQERKAFIANFLMAFLMFIPMAGATAGALGSAFLRTMLNVAGELASIGIGIYEVVDDPDNALLTIFGMLLGGVSLKPFREVAQARRNMKSGELDKLGPIKTDLGRINTLKGKGLSCKKS